MKLKNKCVVAITALSSIIGIQPLAIAETYDECKSKCTSSGKDVAKAEKDHKACIKNCDEKK